MDTKPYLVFKAGQRPATRSEQWLRDQYYHRGAMVLTAQVYDLEDSFLVISMLNNGFEAYRIYPDRRAAYRQLASLAYHLAYVRWYPLGGVPRPGLYQAVGKHLCRISEIPTAIRQAGPGLSGSTDTDPASAHGQIMTFSHWEDRAKGVAGKFQAGELSLEQAVIVHIRMCIKKFPDEAIPNAIKAVRLCLAGAHQVPVDLAVPIQGQTSLTAQDIVLILGLDYLVQAAMQLERT